MGQVIALVREPTSSLAQALSTHADIGTLDFKKALAQHRSYTRALSTVGASLVFLDPLQDCPDSPFVEDTAIILPNLAVMCPMKATTRQGESATMENEVRKYRPVHNLPAPATLDGGDVLDTENTLFVGLSTRSNRESVEALSKLAPKPVVPVHVKKGLHLKTSVSYLGNNLIVIHPASVDTVPFKDFDWIEVDEKEGYAANCLTLGRTVFLAKGFPRVAEKIRARGLEIMELEMSEFEKADGGITCLSILIPEK